MEMLSVTIGLFLMASHVVVGCSWAGGWRVQWTEAQQILSPRSFSACFFPFSFTVAH